VNLLDGLLVLDGCKFSDNTKDWMLACCKVAFERRYATAPSSVKIPALRPAYFRFGGTRLWALRWAPDGEPLACHHAWTIGAAKAVGSKE
jgi:hypothetical protein